MWAEQGDELARRDVGKAEKQRRDAESRTRSLFIFTGLLPEYARNRFYREGRRSGSENTIVAQSQP